MPTEPLSLCSCRSGTVALDGQPDAPGPEPRRPSSTAPASATCTSRQKPLAAASGRWCAADRVCVVGDDPGTTWACSTATPSRASGCACCRANSQKGAQGARAKPDFEICTGWRGGLLALGSGSRPTRGAGGALPQLAAAPIAFALTPLYERLRAELGPLNLEGALLQGEELWLLQGQCGRPARQCASGCTRACSTNCCWVPT